MGWKQYLVVFEIISPLHIGYGRIANLQKSRGYVPGRLIWSAFTSRITAARGTADYEKTGDELLNNTALSYFYPAVEDNGESDLYSIKVCNYNLWIEDYDRQNNNFMEYKFMNSYMSTAINIGSNSADESNLFETEFISPYTRDGEKTYLVGYLFLKDGYTFNWDYIRDIQVGGERKSGFGRIKLHGKSEDNSQIFQSLEVEMDGERPIIEIKSQSRLLAHVHVSESNTMEIKGRIEPLVYRDTKEAKKIGSNIRNIIAYAPGAVYYGDKTSLEIGSTMLKDNSIWCEKYSLNP